MPTIPSNHIRLNYVEDGNGHHLLFIQGPGSSASDWEFQVPEFSKSGTYLVSIRKRPFFALAVSICRIVCAAYSGTPPRNPLISLPGQKIPRFRIGNQ